MIFLVVLCFIPALLSLILFSVFMKTFRTVNGFLALILGILPILPIAALQVLIVKFPVFTNTTFSSLVLTTFLFNGLLEETLKGGFLMIQPKKKLRIENGILAFFALCLVSGFATGGFESVIYFLKKLQDAQTQNFGDTLSKLVLTRMFTAVILHSFCSALTGIGIYQKRFFPFVMAVLIHGTYNFFAGFAFPFWIFSIVALLLAALECRIQIKMTDLN